MKIRVYQKKGRTLIRVLVYLVFSYKGYLYFFSKLVILIENFIKNIKYVRGTCLGFRVGFFVSWVVELRS